MAGNVVQFGPTRAQETHAQGIIEDRLAELLRLLDKRGEVLQREVDLLQTLRDAIDRTAAVLPGDVVARSVAVHGTRSAAYAVAVTTMATRLADAELNLKQVLGGAAG